MFNLLDFIWSDQRIIAIWTASRLWCSPHRDNQCPYWDQIISKFLFLCIDDRAQSIRFMSNKGKYSTRTVLINNADSINHSFLFGIVWMLKRLVMCVQNYGLYFQHEFEYKLTIIYIILCCLNILRKSVYFNSLNK